MQVIFITPFCPIVFCRINKSSEDVEDETSNEKENDVGENNSYKLQYGEKPSTSYDLQSSDNEG